MSSIAYFEDCSNESYPGIVLGEGVETVKNSPIGVKACTPMTHQLMDPLCKELPRLLLGLLHHHSLHISVQPESKGL
jgi:hypothetical protein